MKSERSRQEVAGKGRQKIAVAALTMAAVLTGCTTGNPGAFSETTFFDNSRSGSLRELGPVQGESCQTMTLYLFPMDVPPSTQEAMEQALAAKEGAVFLANVSVERRQHWHVGYSRVCTLVTGTAYAVDGSAD